MKLMTIPDFMPAQKALTSTAEMSLHRSGAVARMLRMPVATLRVWERRYGLTQPALSPSGQRLYSADQVRRLVMLKQLTDLGHAIGSLAPLGMAQLQHVASTHALALAGTQTSNATEQATPAPAWRLAVIGDALGTRLQRPALLRRLGRPVLLMGPFASAAQADAALQGAEVDALVVHAPHLHADWLASVQSAAPALAAVPKAVLYGFAAASVCESLATAGVALLREPQTDPVLAQWLCSLATAATGPLRAAHGVALPVERAPESRWTDQSLTDFAGQFSTLACECPRQVAELLMQLTHFEAYSAECAHRSPADAELHAYLAQVAATSRVHFEAALERVALHEGLVLPASQQLDSTATKASRDKNVSAGGQTRSRS